MSWGASGTSGFLATTNAFAHDPHHKTVGIQHSRLKIEGGRSYGASPPTEMQLLVKHFVLRPEDNVGALSPVFCVRSERVNRLTCSYFV